MASALFVKDGCYECPRLSRPGCSTSTGGTRLGPPQIPLSAFVSYGARGQLPPCPRTPRKVVSNEDLAEIYNFLKSVPPPPAAKNHPAPEPVISQGVQCLPFVGAGLAPPLLGYSCHHAALRPLGDQFRQTPLSKQKLRPEKKSRKRAHPLLQLFELIRPQG